MRKLFYFSMFIPTLLLADTNRFYHSDTSNQQEFENVYRDINKVTSGKQSSIFINVLDYGADNTGTKDSTPQINAAINAAFNNNGGIVYFPHGTYLVNSTSGTITTPGDDGTCSAAFGITPMTAEVTSTISYSINLKQAVKLIGESYQSTLIEGNWTYGVSTINVHQNILINIASGSVSHVEIQNLRIENAMIAVYHDGILDSSRFKDLLIENCGFNFIIDRAERLNFDHIMSFSDGANIVIGGWWRQRNNTQSEINGGYADKNVFSRIDSVPNISQSSYEDTLDQFFDTYWFKRQNNATRTAATIAFVKGSPDQITDTANGFLTNGFGVNFTSGEKINVKYSASNDGIYSMASVTAGTITLTSNNTLTNEVAGSTKTVATRISLPLDGSNSFLTLVPYYGITQTALAVLDRTGRPSYNSSARDIVHTEASRYAIYGGPMDDWHISNVYNESVGIANKSSPNIFGVDYVNPYITSSKIDGIVQIVPYSRNIFIDNVTETNCAATNILSGANNSSWIGISNEVGGSTSTISITNAQPMINLKGTQIKDQSLSGPVVLTDANGFVTKPYQVSFLAVSTGVVNVTGDGTAYNIVFKSTPSNVGNAYNPANGVFTAPIAGIYGFCTNVGLTGISTNTTLIELSINTTQRAYTDTYQETASSSNFQTFITPTLCSYAPMALGDTSNVIIQVNGSATKTVSVGNSNARLTFSGTLLN